MYISPRAARLLSDIEQAHRALIEWSGADESTRRGFRAIYEAFESGVSELTEDDVIAAPSAEEWSMAEVAEHVAEHDRKYMELEPHGISHYVEHGLEHAHALWKMRSARLVGRDRTGPAAPSGETEPPL